MFRGVIVSPSEVKAYTLLFLVIGIIVIVVSLVYRSEELGAIAIPVLVIPASIIAGAWGKWNPKVIYKYFIYGVILSLVLEALSYVLYSTLAGRASSLSILLGIAFFLLYEYYVKRKTSRLRKAESVVEREVEGVKEEGSSQKNDFAEIEGRE